MAHAPAPSIPLLGALLILVLFAAGFALAAAVYLRRLSRPRAAGDLELHPIAGAPGVWLYRGFFSNSAVFAFKTSCLVVDTQVSPHGARRLKREIARKIGLPVRHVIVTHHHGDHMGGNAEFADAEIIASEDTARLALERDDDRTRYAATFGLEFQAWHPTVPPTRLFTEGRLTFEIEGETVDILRLGAGETSDACVVWLPQRRVIASGDSVSTIDYPFLGTPFLDEGLRDDGEWIGVLNRIKTLKPLVLLPGHGPALVEEHQIQDRLSLLATLMRDLLEIVRPLVKAGLEPEAIVSTAGRQLAHHLRHPGLREHTLCQRFAIYRCINSLVPARRGKGWWQDLRPSVIRRASENAVASELAALAGPAPEAAELAAAVARLLKRGRPDALAYIEAVTRRHPHSAAAWGLLSDVLFDGAQGVTPTVDGTEFLAAAGRAAKHALTLDAACPLALLNLGAFEVFGGMVLAQKMDGPLERLEQAAASPTLNTAQRRKALFFIGKAHQCEGRPGESDRFFREALPAPLRPFYPLLRPMMRSTP